MTGTPIRRGTLIDIAIGLLIAATVSVPARLIAANDATTLNAARDLYAAAEYEDALAVLDSLHPTDHESDERRAIDQYRAYCLIALGRSIDAERAIAAVVSVAPLYVPSGADVSPRVRSVFSDVRRRLLPTIVQQKYAAAKAEYDRKNYPAARSAFAEVVAAMADPDMSAIIKDAPFADLRTLAEGFLALSVSATAPTPLAAHAPMISAPRVAVEPKIYSADDARVVAPVAIRQQLPPFPAQVTIPAPGVIEIIIDETGAVVTALLRVAVSPKYDPQLIEAAKGWRFKPATLQGVPVKYRKMIQVAVKR